MLCSTAMPASPNEAELAASELPRWLLSSLPWLGVLILAAVAACAAALWVLVDRARELARLGRRLEALDELRAAVDRLTEQRDDIDLRRLEHVVVDIRDGQRRTEDAVLRAVQSGAGGGATNGALARSPGGARLGERVVNRLLALGFERVQIVTGIDELTALEDGDGDVSVEAHRRGVLHKGRLKIESGAITATELKPAYSTFP